MSDSFWQLVTAYLRNVEDVGEAGEEEGELGAQADHQGRRQPAGHWEHDVEDAAPENVCWRTGQLDTVSRHESIDLKHCLIVCSRHILGRTVHKSLKWSNFHFQSKD